MRRADVLRVLVRDGGSVADRSGLGLSWPSDVSVSAEEAGATVVLVAFGDDDTADDLARRLADVGPATTAVTLVSRAPDEIPVAALASATVAARHQVVGVVPLAEHPGTAVITRPVAAEPVGVHPYLRWDQPGPPIHDDDAVLRLVNEYMVADVVWRAVDVAGHANDEAVAAARDETAGLRAELDDVTARFEQAAADLRAARSDLEALQRRLDRILRSRSYGLARRLASAKRALAGGIRRD